MCESDDTVSCIVGMLTTWRGEVLHAEYQVTVGSSLTEVLSRLWRIEHFATWPAFSRTGAVRFEPVRGGTRVTFVGVLDQADLASLAESAVSPSYQEPEIAAV